LKSNVWLRALKVLELVVTLRSVPLAMFYLLAQPSTVRHCVPLADMTSSIE
jgi:hypothetical protein